MLSKVRSILRARALLSLLCAASGVSAATLVHIQDTVLKIDGSAQNCQVYLSGPSLFSTPTSVMRSFKTISVVAGVLDVSLYPNDTATPAGTSYQAQWVCDDGSNFAETWVIQTSSSAVKLSQIRTAPLIGPSAMILPAQLPAINLASSGPGGVIGNLDVANLNGGLNADASHYWRGDKTWATVTSSGGAWGGITGTLSAQADLQSALNAKQASLGYTPLNAASNLSDVGSVATARDSKQQRRL